MKKIKSKNSMTTKPLLKNTMKILFFLLTSNLLLTSCDSPRDRRSLASTTSNSSNSSFNGFSSGNSSSNTTNTSTTGTTTVSLTIPDDAKHCKFSNDGSIGFNSNGSHISAYTLCKSSSNENTFYAQIKDPNSNTQGLSQVRICFIPMSNKTNNGNPLHIGNPQCGYFSDGKTIQKIVFEKYSNNSSVAITNIMLFKDLTYYYPGYSYNISTLNAYVNCTGALLLYNNSSYCEIFKNAGYYTLYNL